MNNIVKLTSKNLISITNKPLLIFATCLTISMYWSYWPWLRLCSVCVMCESMLFVCVCMWIYVGYGKGRFDYVYFDSMTREDLEYYEEILIWFLPTRCRFFFIKKGNLILQNSSSFRNLRINHSHQNLKVLKKMYNMYAGKNWLIISIIFS